MYTVSRSDHSGIIELLKSILRLTGPMDVVCGDRVRSRVTAERLYERAGDLIGKPNSRWIMASHGKDLVGHNLYDGNDRFVLLSAESVFRHCRDKGEGVVAVWGGPENTCLQIIFGEKWHKYTDYIGKRFSELSHFSQEFSVEEETLLGAARGLGAGFIDQSARESAVRSIFEQLGGGMLLINNAWWEAAGLVPDDIERRYLEPDWRAGDHGSVIGYFYDDPLKMADTWELLQGYDLNLWLFPAGVERTDAADLWMASESMDCYEATVMLEHVQWYVAGGGNSGFDYSFVVGARSSENILSVALQYVEEHEPENVCLW